MADELVKTYGSWLLLIVVFGSMVDIFQFMWIIRRYHKRWKRALYNKVKREIILTEYQNKIKNKDQELY